jgi:hypothetical protein
MYVAYISLHKSIRKKANEKFEECADKHPAAFERKLRLTVQTVR